ncbi:hypothetical protein RKD37_004742 [Streptomyces ambofaciens]
MEDRLDGVVDDVRRVLELTQRAGDVRAVVGQGRQVGVGEGESDDLLVGDRVLQVGEPLLGDRLVSAGGGLVPVPDAVAARHGVDGRQQVRVDHPGDVEVLAQRHHLVQTAAGGDLLRQVVVEEDRGLLLVRPRFGGHVRRRDEWPQRRRPGPGAGLVGLPRQECPLDAEDLLPRLRGGLTGQ